MKYSKIHTDTQSAIKAYTYSVEFNSGRITSAIPSLFGVSYNMVATVEEISDTFGRVDILNILLEGGKFNVGGEYSPCYTDDLGAIKRCLVKRELEDEAEKEDLKSHINSILHEVVIHAASINIPKHTKIKPNKINPKMSSTNWTKFLKKSNYHKTIAKQYINSLKEENIQVQQLIHKKLAKLVGKHKLTK